MITSHDIEIVVAYLVRRSFLDELGTKSAAIKVYKLKLFMSCKLHCLSCHNEWLCHLFNGHDC